MVDYRTAYTTSKKMYQEFRSRVIEEEYSLVSELLFNYGINDSHNNEDIQKILTVVEELFNRMKRRFKN